MRNFKYILDRKSLETHTLLSFGPYLNIQVFYGTTFPMRMKFELEKIQLVAIRIISGTTKLVSLHNIYTETCFQSLKTRRNKHRLTLFYKITNNLCSPYLSSLVPDLVGNTNAYILRNDENFRTINSNIRFYSSSF